MGCVGLIGRFRDFGVTWLMQPVLYSQAFAVLSLLLSRLKLAMRAAITA